MIKGMTVDEAVHKWVDEFNAIPQSMIEQLMRANPDEWEEVTFPRRGNRVYIFDLPESCNSCEQNGEIVEYISKFDEYRVNLDDGENFVLVEPDNLEVQTDTILPMWGMMWSFGDSCDDYWLENEDGIRAMSDCGFRVYRHDEWGYFFGIDGAGYSFMEAHWEPLYRARGLQWHDEKAEHERKMLKKGYTKGKLGSQQVWLDEENNVVEEVK